MGNRKIFFLRLLLTLFFASTIGKAYADYGSIILHKAKFVMKNGLSITGYVPLSNYNVSMSDYKDIHQDKAFQKLINKYYFVDRKTLEFRVFKKFKTLISPLKSSNPLDKEFFYTDSTSICTLNLDSIKYTVYLNGQDKPALFWKQIEVFDLNTVDLMTHVSIQYYTNTILFNSSNFSLNAHIFCFNSNLSYAEYLDAIRNFGNNVNPKLRPNFINYQDEVKALEKIGIVVFFWAEGSC
jgi:hypothetical protein